jgi:hypothetical protein
LELNGQRFAGVQGEAVEAPLAPPTEHEAPGSAEPGADSGGDSEQIDEVLPESDGKEGEGASPPAENA